MSPGFVWGVMSFGAAEKWVHQWVLDEENSRPIIKKALELGINFFDTANVYSMGASEEILGRALKVMPIEMKSRLQRRFISECMRAQMVPASHERRL